MSDSAILKHGLKALFGRCPESQLSRSAAEAQDRSQPEFAVTDLCDPKLQVLSLSQGPQKTLLFTGSGGSRPQPVVQSKPLGLRLSVGEIGVLESLWFIYGSPVICPHRKPRLCMGVYCISFQLFC